MLTKNHTPKLVRLQILVNFDQLFSPPPPMKKPDLHPWLCGNAKHETETGASKILIVLQ